MSDTAPLHSRLEGDPVAWLVNPIKSLDVPTGEVSVKEFLAHVHALLGQLPDKRYAINLCENRYLFLVAFCACVLRRQISLMPPNKNVVTQEKLANDYHDAYIIHDGVSELANIEQLNINSCEFNLPEVTQCDAYTVSQEIDLDQVAVICFTSGSTGHPKPNVKTWRTLVKSSAINGRYMLPNQEETFYHLATVPGQHMWGFETSVLFALFNNVCLVDTRPSFPQDIAKTLNALPIPRTIIATPLHLRAMLGSQSEFSEIESILCATAPLSQQLAQDIESKFKTKVREVYGCSEVGSMAIRQTARSQKWLKFSGIRFSVDESGKVAAGGNHLLDSVYLEDRIEMLDSEHFRLQGRVTDQIKIAGKRGSLHEVNQVLASFPGLVDGVVIFPEQDKAVPRLVALVVLPESIDLKLLRAHFQKHLDAAFVPRPILRVAQLPREENGKLIKERLNETYQSLVLNKS